MTFKYSPGKMRQGALPRDFIAPSVPRLNAGDIAEDKQAILQNAQDKDISLSLIGRGAKDNGNNRTGIATRPNAKSN